jgi:hypothetical protein
MNCMQRAVAVMIALSVNSLAADFHATPTGAGTKDGSSAANAISGSELSTVFNERMQPGDRLVLGPGEYPSVSISLTNGGTAGNPKLIEGNGAVFKSGWSIEKPDKGATAIALAPGVSHVTVKNLSIKNYCFAIRSNPGEARTHLTFDNIQIEQMRHGIYVSDCDNLTITGVKMKRYSKHGFRFDQGCDHVLVRDCVADCSEGDADWETKTEVFPFGYNVNNGGTPNSAIRFENCIARNNIKSNQKVRYTNGDGFVAEANTNDIAFIGCHSLRNQDGGFDIKVKDAKFVDCVAIGHRRDFRIWKSATLENCFAGFSSTGLWSNGGPLVVNHCTFIGHRKSGLELEDKGPGPLTVTNSLIASGEKDYRIVIGKAEIDTSNLTSKSVADLGIPNPDPRWDGTGSAMDSTFGEKGFHSKRVGKAD